MIPERNKVKCEGCGEVVDCQGTGNAQFVSGWSVNRPRGTNGVAFQERHQRWLCRWCIDKRRAGIAPTQQSLFGDARPKTPPPPPPPTRPTAVRDSG